MDYRYLYAISSACVMPFAEASAGFVNHLKKIAAGVDHDDRIVYDA